jgi:hypothetical protein
MAPAVQDDGSIDEIRRQRLAGQRPVAPQCRRDVGESLCH